jgi:predicted ester cyclase
MTQSRKRLLIERFYLEMWNRFDKSIVSEILTEDLRFRGSLGQSKNGHSEFGEYVDFVQRAFPDFSNEIEEIISEGDKAFAKLLYRGTHRGEIFGITPTGRPVRYAGAAVFKFRGDRIAEVWVLGDIYGLISQLQAIDPLPADSIVSGKASEG